MQYITDENGEILDVIEENERYLKAKSGDRVVRGGTIEYLNGTVPIKFHFIKLNDKACNELCEYGNILFPLFQYVDFSTGILRFSNGRLVRPKHLASILRRKRRSGTKIASELIELDVLHKHKEGNTFYYTMNPWILLKGKRITKELYEEFKNTKYRNIDWEI